MRRIAKIALAAAVAAAAVQAVRWLLERDGRSADALPAPAPSPVSSPTPSGAGRTNSSGAGTERTRDELYGEAKRLEIEGRSKMNKQELKQAVEAAKTGGSTI
jgi:hypothetical protein